MEEIARVVLCIETYIVRRTSVDVHYWHELLLKLHDLLRENNAVLDILFNYLDLLKAKASAHVTILMHKLALIY